MSTTFGITIPGKEDLQPTPIAFRSANSEAGLVWMNDLAEMLPDCTLVVPLDNSAQGIYTIGDIKKEMAKKHIQNEPDTLKVKSLLNTWDNKKGDVVYELILNKKLPPYSGEEIAIFIENLGKK